MMRMHVALMMRILVVRSRSVSMHVLIVVVFGMCLTLMRRGIGWVPRVAVIIIRRAHGWMLDLVPPVGETITVQVKKRVACCLLCHSR